MENEKELNAKLEEVIYAKKKGMSSKLNSTPKGLKEGTGRGCFL